MSGPGDAALGIFSPGESLLHRLDAAAKMLALPLWFAVTLLVSRPVPLALLAAAVAAGFVSSRTLPVLRRFLPFLVVLCAGSALLWWLFSRDEAALDKGVRIGARLGIMLSMGLVLLATTRVEEMAAGLRRLGLPFRAAFALTLAFRLIPLFAAMGRAIVEAQTSRGLDPRRGSLPARARAFVSLVVPLVLGSLRSASGLAVALESRGLGMSPARTSVLQGRFGPAEGVAVALPALSLAALALLRERGLML